MTSTTDSLERKIEAAVALLVREHMSACETAAMAAVRAGFRRASEPSPKSAGREKPKRSGTPSPRRSPEELEALCERLYEAIRAHPGETMLVIAPAVGVTAKELWRPAGRLRRTGRIRSAGERFGTRYYPME